MWASNSQFTKACVGCRRKLEHPEKPTSLWGEGANSTEKVHNGNLKDRSLLLGGYDVIRDGRGASETSCGGSSTHGGRMEPISYACLKR